MASTTTQTLPLIQHSRQNTVHIILLIVQNLLINEYDGGNRYFQLTRLFYFCFLARTRVCVCVRVGGGGARARVYVFWHLHVLFEPLSIMEPTHFIKAFP